MQRRHYHIPIRVPGAVQTPLLHIYIDRIQFLVSSFPRKECVTSAIAESNGMCVLGHCTIFKPTVETSIPSAPFQKMQSFNSFSPLNAYFYPPVESVASSSTVIDPSVLDPLLYEDTNSPNSPQQHCPSIYYPNNFQPPDGFSTVTSSSSPEPVGLPFGINEATSFLNSPHRHYPSTYDPNNFMPLQNFSMVESSIPEPDVDPSEIDYLSVYWHPSNLPLQGLSRESHTVHPRVTPASSADNIRICHSSAIPAGKPSVRKTRIRNRKRLGEEGRKEYLQNDAYLMSFGKTWVTCAGCRNIIKLDSRKGARYYAGFWLRHKGHCPGVKKEIVRFLSEKYVY